MRTIHLMIPVAAILLGLQIVGRPLPQVPSLGTNRAYAVAPSGDSPLAPAPHDDEDRSVKTVNPSAPPAGRLSGSDQFFASPTGSPAGDGSLRRPWDLQTALKQPAAVRPGATIWLRGGTYVGHFTSELAGTPSAPITVRSYPGEWAKIDGYKPTALSRSISADDTTISFTDASGLSEGDRVQVGIINSQSPAGVENVLLGARISGDTFNAIRGWDGTDATAFSGGTPAIVAGGTTGAINVNGSDAVYRDFEVTYSGLPRSFQYYVFAEGGRVGARPEGFEITGPRTKFINLVVHDAREGFNIESDATDVEVYGAVIYNNGQVDTVRGHGHGLYLQNQTGTKKVTDVISVNNFGTGMKAFGEQGSAVGIDFSGVISFNNGSPGTFSGNPADYEPAFRFANLLVGTAENPSDRITVNNVYTYDPDGTIADDGNVSFGYTAQGNKGLVVKDNYIAGGQSLFALKGGWDDATVTGNTFYATSVFDVNANSALVSVQDLPQAYSYLWDRNAYFDGTPAKNCYGDSKRAPFYFGNVYSPCNQSAGGPLDFSEWRQSLGFDANSTYAEGRPAGVTIFIRPNQYEAGRAHVAIYNWDLRPAVTVNLSESGLTSGQRYEIRDAQNYFGSPLVSATYNAKRPLVSIPMTNLSVAAPIGSHFVPPHTAPEFGAFVVLPLSKENNSPSHREDH